MLPDSPALVETDVLIIGTGPAGAALACFLAQNGPLLVAKLADGMLTYTPGIKGLIVNYRSSTVTTPRAHLVKSVADSVGIMIALARLTYFRKPGYDGMPS